MTELLTTAFKIAAVLIEGPRNGYRIREAIAAEYGPIAYSTVHEALGPMVNDGLLTATDGHGRHSRDYELTDAGLAMVERINDQVLADATRVSEAFERRNRA